MVITTVESLKESTAGYLHVSRLRLELGRSSDLEALTQHVRSVRTARCVFLSSEVMPSMSEPDWASHDAEDLFEALASLKGVQELHLQDLGISFGPQGPRFPVSLLTTLLRGWSNAKKNATAAAAANENANANITLEKLVLGVRFVGKEEAFQEFADALAGHKALKHVSWEEWCFPVINHNALIPGTPSQEDDAAPFDFNPILTALATLPNLEALSIKAMTAGGRDANLGVLEAYSLVRLVSKNNSKKDNRLRHLQLVHFQLQSKTVEALSQVLKKNETVELLSLDLSDTGPDGALALFDMLRYNQNIQQFQVWASTSVAWDKEHCLLHLADALKTNKAVKSVAIMTHSRTIQEIIRGRKIIDDTVAAAFVGMLESNCYLESLVLDDYGEDEKALCRLTSLMLYYLALNCSGRRQNLLQQCHSFSRFEWAELLGRMAAGADESIKLDIVHYFLKLNPSLCQMTCNSS